MSWVNAYWAENVREDYKATLEIIAIDNGTALSEISTLFSNQRIPVFALNARQTSDGRISMSVTIAVANTDHLNSVISKISDI